MKKIFKTLSASVLMALALTACQKEEFGGNEAEGIYTFEVSADNIATKAAIDRDGNGTAVNRFIMEVYLAKTTGELVLLDRQVKAPTAASPKSTSFNLTLIKDQEYKVLFWADKGTDAMEDLYYKTTDNLQNVSFLNAARIGNNDALDAFSKMEVITREESKAGFSKSVKLTRPFGQVNFITTDIPAINALTGGSAFLPTDVKVSYVTCTGFNVLTQTGTGSEAIEYTAPVYSAMDPATNPAKYTLSMDYMLTATSDRETRNLVKLTALANGYELTTVEVANCPVQRNYRTNILGNLLTSQVIFNIEIVPIFNEPDNDIDLVNIKNVESLKALFATGGSATLSEDLVVNEPISVATGAEVTLDLNGKTIKNNSNSVALDVYGSLVINGEGTVDGGEGGDNVAVCSRPGGKLTINGGTYIVGADANGSGNSTIYTTGGDVIINGGTFSTAAKYGGRYWTINKRNGSTGKVEIYGGTFPGFDPANPNTDDAASYLAPGYISVETNGVWTVVRGTKPVVMTTAELRATLTAFTGAGSGDNVIEIGKDIVLKEGETWVPVKVDGYHGAGVVTVLGNGHKISGLNAPLFAGGFAGNSGIVVKDLTLDGVKINDATSTQGIGAFVCNVDSMPRIELDNCHLTNSEMISTGGARVGGLIGWTSGYNNPNDGPVKTYINITKCSVESCKISAKGSVGGIIGHAGSNPATYHTISDCSVKNCDLTSTDDGDWRVGVVVGTANVGKLTIKNITESGNTITQTGKDAPKHSNLYGRFVPGTTGELVIDGAAQSQ